MATTTRADVVAAVLARQITVRDAETWFALTHGPPRSQAEIGYLLGGISQSQVSRKAQRLERAGLLRIIRHRRQLADYRPAPR